MEIKLENVSYYDHEIIKGDCLNSPHKIHKYLDNCSATITSGTLVGIIGSPSETKNLLQLISLRNLSGQVLGHIQHDNSIRKIGTSCYRDIAYISSTSSANCQYFHYLTITNYLLWSIQLRSILSSLSEYTNRVYEICHLLDLNGSLHIHELEEGQLFLLSLATELVTNPTLICIESPIDNLDEYSSILIIQTLQKIAHRFNTSTTIIFTALGPSSTIYSYLDQIIIFYINKILYSSKGFFEKDIFHHRPLGFNRGGQVSSHQTTPMKTPPPPAPPSPLSSSSHLHETTISSSTFDYCYQTFELISREFKRSGYGTKLFYLSPDLLRTVSKDVEIVHFLIADPHQSNTLLESYIDRIYSREMHEKREKLEGILQRYIQLIVTKCIEYNSEQRKHESEKSHEERLS